MINIWEWLALFIVSVTIFVLNHTTDVPQPVMGGMCIIFLGIIIIIDKKSRKGRKNATLETKRTD